nr:MAG TPA: hypothetical protein [Caudoviricetes sp.]
MDTFLQNTCLGNFYPILDYQPDRGFFNVFVELL